jgi:hypothetical protein
VPPLSLPIRLAQSSSEKLMALLGLASLGNRVEFADELVEEQLEDDGGRGRGMVGCLYFILTK